MPKSPAQQRTEDGGITWAAVAGAPDLTGVVSPSDAGGVVWADATRVLIHGLGGTILRSADAGLTWTNVSLGSITDSYADMAFNAAGIGMAAGLVMFIWGQKYLHGHADAREPQKLRETVFAGLNREWAIYLGVVYAYLPFMVLPLYAALDRLDRSLIEASLDLGAGHFRTLTQIVAPLAAPGIISGVIITFVPALGAYLTPDLMGGPDSQMIANVIERQFKKANDWPFGAALSFILIYAMFILIALQAMRKKVPEVR